MMALLPFIAVAVCILLAWLVLARARREPVHWAVAAALAALALCELGNGLSLIAGSLNEVLRGRRIALIGEMIMPVGWLIFSLTFARSAVPAVFREWRPALWAIGLITTVFLTHAWSDRLFDASGFTIILGPTGLIFIGLYLVAQVLILANLEQAMRQADEYSRWYIKCPAVGLGLLCAYFVYQSTDLLLYQTWRSEHAWLSGAVAIAACAIMGYGLLRRPIPDVQIYVSPRVVAGSLTFVIVGGALLGTGAFAGFLRYSGLPGGMALSVFTLFVGVTALAFVLLSSQWRQTLGRFVERHFFPHQYDYRARWKEVTGTLAVPGTPEQISWRAVQLIKGIVGAKSVALWLVADAADGLWTRLAGYQAAGPHRLRSEDIRPWLHGTPRAIDPERTAVPAPMRAAMPEDAVLLVPLHADREPIGWIVLGPPAAGDRYRQQDVDLLACIAAQVADRLQHLMLSDRLLLAREMEAVDQCATFILHDLKNFTAALSLVVQNAERHGSDPAFQQAAMKSVSGTVAKMSRLMNTVAALARDPRPATSRVDLNDLVGAVLKDLSTAGGALVREQGPVPPVAADADQLQQVLLNLILNAQEAIGPDGRILIRTRTDGRDAVLIVEDNGCGMDATTMAGLFRPFRSRKGRGLGIGLYQCRKIVQAHGGRLEVDSEIGRGSRFVIRLPGTAALGLSA